MLLLPLLLQLAVKLATLPCEGVPERLLPPVLLRWWLILRLAMLVVLLLPPVLLRCVLLRRLAMLLPLLLRIDLAKMLLLLLLLLLHLLLLLLPRLAVLLLLFLPIMLHLLLPILLLLLPPTHLVWLLQLSTAQRGAATRQPGWSASSAHCSWDCTAGCPLRYT